MYCGLADRVDPKEKTDFIREVFELGTCKVSREHAERMSG